jgi:2'-5' RNA ligase
MRAFIAIEISEEIRNSLGRIQGRLRYAGADVKWVDEKNIHLTLKFLGEISEEKRKKVESAIDAVAGRTKPFGISVKDTGAFPKMEYPRVIWAGLDNGADEARALAEDIDGELSGIGFQKETRPFAAHLTIGRVRSPKNLRQLAEKLAGCQKAEAGSQTVGSIALFQSTLTPSGSIYTKLHSSPLAVH